MQFPKAAIYVCVVIMIIPKGIGTIKKLYLYFDTNTLVCSGQLLLNKNGRDTVEHLMPYCDPHEKGLFNVRSDFLKWNG